LNLFICLEPAESKQFLMYEVYVESMAHNNTLAVSIKPENIAHNLSVLKEFYDPSRKVFTAGRYICIVLFTPMSKKYLNIVFIDHVSNRGTTEWIVKQSGYPQKIVREIIALSEYLDNEFHPSHDIVKLVVE
jgi:hypothetical protein